jgi:hypothetical protein
MQSRAAVAFTPRLAAIFRSDIPAADSLGLSASAGKLDADITKKSRPFLAGVETEGEPGRSA